MRTNKHTQALSDGCCSKKIVRNSSFVENSKYHPRVGIKPVACARGAVFVGDCNGCCPVFPCVCCGVSVPLEVGAEVSALWNAVSHSSRSSGLFAQKVYVCSGDVMANAWTTVPSNDGRAFSTETPASGTTLETFSFFFCCEVINTASLSKSLFRIRDQRQHVNHSC